MSDPTTSLPNGIWKLDPSTTTIATSLKWFRLLTVPASFEVSNSTIAIATSDEGDAGGSIEIEVDAASYTGGNNKRNEHVRGPDFLDSANHPTFRFIGTSMEEVDVGYRVLGELTVQDRTTQAEFLVTDLQATGEQASFIASTELDRQALGIDKMPSFVIGDTVAVTVRARAARQ